VQVPQVVVPEVKLPAQAPALPHLPGLDRLPDVGAVGGDPVGVVGSPLH
jgi:hypothetical protein